MLIEDKFVNVIIDLGVNCNLMLEEMFEFIIGVMLFCQSVIREFMFMFLQSYLNLEESII